MKRLRLAAISLAAAISLSCLAPVSTADTNEIHGAYNFYGDKQLYNYCEGTKWNYDYLYAYTWMDENDENLLCRLSVGFQFEAYQDMVKSLKEELEMDGTLILDMRDGTESSVGKIGGIIPSYTKNTINEANKFVETALSQVGEKDSAPGAYDNKFNAELGYVREPWSAVFVSWVAKECGLLDKAFGPARALAEDLFNDLTLYKGYKYYENRTIDQWTGSDDGYQAVPGDIIFWEDFKHCGIVTETGEDYITVTQGNTMSGHVLPIIYKRNDPNNELPETLLNGKIVHVVYPNSVFNQDAVKMVVDFFSDEEIGFNSATILGMLGNMDVESGVIPYRCEGDMDGASGYEVSKNYTAAVDDGQITRTQFIYPSGEAVNLNGTTYYPNGYGLVQFTFYKYKEDLYDLAAKMGRSVGDAEVQMIVLTNHFKATSISQYQIRYEAYDQLTIDLFEELGNPDSMTLYELLKNCPDTEQGTEWACNLMLTYYERPADPDLSDRLSRAYKYKDNV